MKKLLSSYFKWNKLNTESYEYSLCTSDTVKYCTNISFPFTDIDGELIKISFYKEKDKITIFSEDSLLENVFYNPQEPFKEDISDKDKNILLKILNKYKDIKLEEDLRLSLECTKEDFPQKLNLLLQALIEINNVFNYIRSLEN